MKLRVLGAVDNKAKELGGMDEGEGGVEDGLEGQEGTNDHHEDHDDGSSKLGELEDAGSEAKEFKGCGDCLGGPEEVCDTLLGLDDTGNDPEGLDCHKEVGDALQEDDDTGDDHEGLAGHK